VTSQPIIRVLATTALIVIVACFGMGRRLPGAAPANAQDKKLGADDLVARHLQSIGTAQARADVKTRAVVGAVTFKDWSGQIKNTDGVAALISAGSKVRYGMSFVSTFYPREQIAFDGAHPKTMRLPSGARSPLAAFLDTQTGPLTEGLFCGVLSTAWPLMDMQRTQPKLSYHGVKKVDGQPLLQLEYRPRKGSDDLTIMLYFDPDTFRHRRTEYTYTVSNILNGSRPGADRQADIVYLLSEDFDDFQSVDGLTLPHAYRLQLSVQGRGSVSLREWTLAVKSISHAEKLDDAKFKID
jgi:hypothetical protein